jgi:hypothetical protein
MNVCAAAWLARIERIMARERAIVSETSNNVEDRGVQEIDH